MSPSTLPISPAASASGLRRSTASAALIAAAFASTAAFRRSSLALRSAAVEFLTAHLCARCAAKTWAMDIMGNSWKV